MSAIQPNGRDMSQIISPNDIEAGARYKLTYWIKHEDFDDGASFWFSLATQSRDWDIYINYVGGPKVSKDWTEYSAEFNIPANLSPSNYYLIFWYEIWREPLVGWIDNISLTKVK